MVYHTSGQKIFNGQKALLTLTICITLALAFYLIAPSPVLALLHRLADQTGTSISPIPFTDGSMTRVKCITLTTSFFYSREISGHR